MGYIYTDKTREGDPRSLPDAGVFGDRPAAVHCNRDDCGAASVVPTSAVEATLPEVYCPDCGYHSASARYARSDTGRWWYAFLDGGLDCWSSDPSGPYDTEEEAIKAAREAAGCCEHGIPEDGDTVCEECPAPELWVIRRPQSHSYVEAISLEGVGSAVGWTRDTSKVSAWSTRESAERCRLASVGDAGIAVKLSDTDARRWGR
jgi:hypothetical protein